MTDFVQGQRWVVDSEPELGLGMVVGMDERTVTILFPEVDTERRYNAQQAPLTRIQFEVGDEIQPREGEPQIVATVHEQNGVLVYETQNGQLVVETMLAGSIRLNQPYMRLITGQLDKPNWFHFRRKFDNAMTKAWCSGLKGYLGVRANLIPHQLYVATSACNRERVRVLLADEVGLGKTLEAGLILSRLLKLERVSRALIIVPDTLQVQWLVELVRKFSLYPSLYDGEGYDFGNAGVHIVPHSALITEQENLLSHDFDIAIVDEAHHISMESEGFAVLKMLSTLLNHLILLTATPEQLGAESHFARLQLLDAAKFTDFDSFISQENTYAELSKRIQDLPAGKDRLVADLGLEPGDDEFVIKQLLDQHGVGRVMFRNARKAVAGFPARICLPHQLEEDGWDGKFEWLAQWLKANSKQKALVICHTADTVKECELYLWEKHGIDVAVFYEEQTLIERDKSAAYFADEERGARILLCSEIGSEGRNFQFSSHLICLDLPDHPELLEQRIGRLDRIGQKNDVSVHVPCHPESDTAKQLFWYNDVLNCVEQQNPASTAIHDKYWQQDSLSWGSADLAEIREELAQLQLKIVEGRDALLELNSCRQPFADQLAQSIADFEQATPEELVSEASELLQFHYEQTFDGIFSLIPSDKMLIPALPGLPAEGVELTYDRDIANSREDLHFLTWDSPFIEGLWELLHHSELGSASVAMLPSRQLPAGHCLLEVCFDFMIQSPAAKECLPFIQESSVRSLVLDVGENDLSGILPESALEANLQGVKKHLAREVIKSRKEAIPQWFKKAEDISVAKKSAVQAAATERAQSFFEGEIKRLKTLKAKNPLIDDAEIALLEAKSQAVQHAINHAAHLQLSAIRLIVITPAE